MMKKRFKCILVIVLLSAFGGTAQADSVGDLQTAWEQFTAGLAEGRDGIDTTLPARAPLPPIPVPPADPTDRNLADGYRYLLGHIVRIIESETLQHPDFPYFFRSTRLLSKWTGDNPDQMYLKAIIDPNAYYEIRGKAKNTDNWQYGGIDDKGPKAPRIFTIATITATIGDTGSLGEFPTCRNQTLDTLTHFDLIVDKKGKNKNKTKGEFKILVGPEKPAGYDGNFLLTKALMPCTLPDGTTIEQPREADQISIRETFNDWDSEEALDLEIVNLEKEGANRPAASVDDMAQALQTIGEKVANQVIFWSSLQHISLEVNGDTNGDGIRAMPVNGLNPVEPPFVAGGTAAALNLYSGGLFELMNEDGEADEDKALIIKITDVIAPHYHSFHLYDYWMQSLDQANYTSSRNRAQAVTSSDGSIYFIIAHKDPGVQNWIDTTGLPKGSMVNRFAYTETATDEEMPILETIGPIPFDEISEYLPDDTPYFSPEQRREEISRRQAHIKRRWRQY